MILRVKMILVISYEIKNIIFYKKNQNTTINNTFNNVFYNRIFSYFRFLLIFSKNW